jgi:MFS family permease
VSRPEDAVVPLRPAGRSRGTAKRHYELWLPGAMPSPPSPNRVLRGVYLSTVFEMAAYSLVVVALPFRFQELGLSVLQYGTVLAVYALGMLATESLWGALAFRIGRPRPIVLLGGVVAAILLSTGLASSFLDFAVTLGLLGMFMIFPVPLMRWLALTARGPGTAGSGTGRYGLFFGAGLVVGASVGPFLYVRFGFLSLALIAVALSGISTLFLAVLPWKEVGLPPRELGTRGQVRAVLSRHFVLCSLVVVLFFVAYSLTLNFLQYYSVALFGGTPAQAGYVIGAGRGTALVAGFFLGPLVDRWGAARVSPAGFLLVVAGALGTLFSPSYAEMVAATLVFAVGAGWLSASLLPLALGPVPRPAQGTAIGVFGSFEDLGLLVGPVLIGGVYATYGATSIFPVVAVVGLLGAAVALTLGGDSEAESTAAEPGLPQHG